MSTIVKSPLHPISVLTDHLEVGLVELLVKNLPLMRDFYQHLVGLEVLDFTDTIATLGYSEKAIIRLIEDSSLSFAARGSAGLYHNAIVFESQSVLAHTLAILLEKQPRLYQGSADHLVSEAFYFQDPEGNGLELYFDKDPSTWVWQNGQVMMGSLFIDVTQYIEEHLHSATLPGKKMGHIHLKVGSIDVAKKFYGDVLGFRTIAEMPTALFVSDGQYHHHIGMNVWESNGAGPKAESLGLKSAELIVHNLEDITKLSQRLELSGVHFKKEDGQVIVHDPWNNELRFTC